jgi:hypothetical protein
MRLIDVKSLELRYFVDQDVPPYAILSHTWGPDEVSFQDMNGDHSPLKRRQGYKKITGCCAKARLEGLPYVWIDTCCI